MFGPKLKKLFGKNKEYEVRPCWRECDFIEGGVSLWVGFEVSFSFSLSLSLSVQLLDQMIALSYCSSALPVTTLCHDDHGLPSETISKPSIKWF